MQLNRKHSYPLYIRTLCRAELVASFKQGEQVSHLEEDLGSQTLAPWWPSNAFKFNDLRSPPQIVATVTRSRPKLVGASAPGLSDKTAGCETRNRCGRVLESQSKLFQRSRMILETGLYQQMHEAEVVRAGRRRPTLDIIMAVQL